MNAPQRISLARLLTQLRPDWDPAGTHTAVTTLAEQPHASPIAACQQALRAAALADNRTPTSITWRDQARPDLEQTAPCPAHGGKTRRPNGTYACCWTEDADPVPFIRTGVTPPPPDFAAQVAAAKANAPAPSTIDRPGIGRHDRDPSPTPAATAGKRDVDQQALDQARRELDAARPVDPPNLSNSAPGEQRVAGSLRVKGAEK